MAKARVTRRRYSAWQFLIWIMPIFLLWTIGASQAGNQCCANGKLWNESAECIDGIDIEKLCKEGIYMIEPDENPNDNFTIVNGKMIFFELEDSLPEDKFCLMTRDGHSVALVCFQEDSPVTLTRYILFGILHITSALFLILTILVYALLPELRDLQGKAMLSAISSLTAGYIVLALQQFLPLTLEIFANPVCLILAFTLYYAFLATFFWLNAVSFNVWISVWFKHFAIKDTTLFVIYSIIGWGGPAFFLIATLIAHHVEGQHIKPGFGEHACWFTGYLEKWLYFYGPVALLLSLNVIYFSMTSWRLWHEYRAYSGSRLRVLRFKCLLYLKLFLAMGVTWIFEVTSFASGERNESYWIATDILNSLQGVIIFIVLVASRKRVRKLLAKKKPCGIAFPKSWAAGEDEECETVLPEELELSQST